MIFYKAAGGQDGTPLKNRYMNYTDMSDLLWSGQAVLVAHSNTLTFAVESEEGEISYPAALRSSIYRFVLPVVRLQEGDR